MMLVLLSVAIITTTGIPSSYRQSCADEAKFAAKVKELQISGKTEEATLEQLEHEGYDFGEHDKYIKALIKMIYEEIATPQTLRKEAYDECLKNYKK